MNVHDGFDRSGSSSCSAWPPWPSARGTASPHRHSASPGSTWMLDPRGSTPGKRLLAIGETASWQRLAQ